MLFVRALVQRIYHEWVVLLQGIKSKYGLQDAEKIRKDAIYSMVSICPC